MQKVARNTRSCQNVAEQLVESPMRPYYPVLTYAVTSKTTLNRVKVRHYSNKKYWSFKYLVTGAKGGGRAGQGGGGEGREDGGKA